MAVLKIKDANGVWQTVQTLLGNAGGGSGDAIPKIGNRGVLAGYESIDEDMLRPGVITKDSADTVLLTDVFDSGETLVTEIPDSDLDVSWLKVGIYLIGAPEINVPESELVFGENWVWGGSGAPVLEQGEYAGFYSIIFWWFGGSGYAIPVKLFSI